MCSFFVGYIKNSEPNAAITLFHHIQNPTEVSFNLFFNACAQVGTEESLELAKKTFAEMPKHVHSNVYVLTSMLDVSMKCGDVTYAECLFNQSSKKESAMYGVMMKGEI